MSTKSTVSENYNYFIKTDTSKYKGEWIAIAEKKIVSHGKNAEDVYKLAQEKAPDEQMFLLCNIPTLLGRTDVFDKFQVTFQQKKGIILFS